MIFIYLLLLSKFDIMNVLLLLIVQDIANLFTRPIAAFVSVFLSISMLFILFFGVITSPFGYMVRKLFNNKIHLKFCRNL